MSFNSTTSNQTTTPSLSSPRPSSLQSSLHSRAAAFIPITPPVATNTAAGKGVGNNKSSYRSRAAPQCSPTSGGGRRPSTPHNKSPTSVAYAHQGAPRTPRNAGSHHNTGGASSPAQGKKFKTEMCTNVSMVVYNLWYHITWEFYEHILCTNFFISFLFPHIDAEQWLVVSLSVLLSVS